MFIEIGRMTVILEEPEGRWYFPGTLWLFKSFHKKFDYIFFHKKFDDSASSVSHNFEIRFFVMNEMKLKVGYYIIVDDIENLCHNFNALLKKMLVIAFQIHKKHYPRKP